MDKYRENPQKFSQAPRMTTVHVSRLIKGTFVESAPSTYSAAAVGCRGSRSKSAMSQSRQSILTVYLDNVDQVRSDGAVGDQVLSQRIGERASGHVRLVLTTRVVRS